MPTRDEPWPDGTPCWADCQLDDVGKGREFYTELFGWEWEEGPPDQGGYVLATKEGRAVAGAGPKPPGMETMPSVWTSYLAADDVDKTTSAVTEHGGSVLAEPMEAMDAGRMAIVADPQGAVVGLWQARAHIGMGLQGDPGTVVWQELHTRDGDAARRFYTDLFGYTYEDIDAGEGVSYGTFSRPGLEQPAGGIMQDPFLPPDVPGYWMTWFETSDADGSADTARRHGSTILMGPQDSPYGRMVVVQGPQGEVFGLMDSSRRSGG